jgi:hypothetical protein
MHVASCPLLRPGSSWPGAPSFHGEQETLAGWSFTASFVFGVDYTSTIEFIHQVVVVVVGCSVATSNDACVREIRGYFLPRHVGLSR